MEYQKIQGYTGLVKDVNTGAVINLNAQEGINARARKMKWKQQQEEFENMKESVKELKTDVNDIKNLLNKIVERL